MKSAYATLGVPGNATVEEIAEAFRRVSNHYSRERLVENPNLIEKLDEAREAYKFCRMPMRARPTTGS